MSSLRAPVLAGAIAGLLAATGCHPQSHADAGSESDGGVSGLVATHSSSIAISADGGRLFVVNADSDSVSIVDVSSRTLVTEVQLAAAPPTPNPDGGIYTPTVYPRTLALSPDGATLYVAGERSGMIHAVDVASATVTQSVAVGSEPYGLLVSPDGKSVYAACSQDGTVVRVDTTTWQVAATGSSDPKPWALAWGANGALYATHLLVSELSEFDPTTLASLGSWTIPDTQPRSDPRLAHGKVRGLYDIAPRPGTDELWIAHVMLGVDTPQPTLDFEETVFPTLTVMHSDGTMEARLSTNAQDVPGINGAFADIVSGPHAVAFTSDGAYALLADTNSEDVLVVDANGRIESSLLRPLPGHMQEGIVLSPDGTRAYVDERNTGDIAVLDVTISNGLTLAVDGQPIPRLQMDPMPTQLRLGQHLFYSANSDELPITKNHWVACATCHLEGRSDAVTWLFEQGPRDTPSNAGGVTLTGFLFRTADRRQVQNYWKTIDVEQGGNFSATDPNQAPQLDAIANYVNQAIPLPIPPSNLDPNLVDAGRAVFVAANCIACHSGPAFTDSALDNPSLDLTGDAGPILLHDVGTCVGSTSDVNFFGYGVFPDVGHDDIEGDSRAACQFDTPTLRGVSDSAPYLHAGTATTLDDIFADGGSLAPGMLQYVDGGLSDAQVQALVEYLKSL